MTIDGRHEKVQLNTKPGRILGRCEAVQSRDFAESIRGKTIWVEREEIPLSEKEEYLWIDLMGREVIDAKSNTVGKIENVFNHGSSDVIVVKNGDKKVDVPFIRDYVDMDFSASDIASIRLKVTIETFSELWY